MPALRPRLLAFLVATLLLLPATGFARVVHLCSAMGQVVSSCCCGERTHQRGHSSSDDAEENTVERVPCCTADVEGTPTPPASAVTQAPELPAAALANLAIEVERVGPLQTYHSVPPARSRASPPAGRPLYLQHRAFLS